MQRYSRKNMNSHMLSEEKSKSVLMPSQDIMLFLYPVINSRRDLVSTSFKYFYKILFTQSTLKKKKKIVNMFE